jgi:hypothetical protein
MRWRDPSLFFTREREFSQDVKCRQIPCIRCIFFKILVAAADYDRCVNSAAKPSGTNPEAYRLLSGGNNGLGSSDQRNQRQLEHFAGSRTVGVPVKARATTNKVT